MALTTKEVQENSPYQDKFPSEIKGIVVASFIDNPDNVNESLLIFPKDYVKGYTYKDYYGLGFRPVMPT